MRLNLAQIERHAKSAVQFASSGATNDTPPVPRYFTVGGFSSQTFDSLFREMAVSLPDSLARDLMRYHWRLKFLMVEQEAHEVMDRFASFYHEAKELHEALLQRLKVYSSRRVARLMLRGRE